MFIYLAKKYFPDEKEVGLHFDLSACLEAISFSCNDEILGLYGNDIEFVKSTLDLIQKTKFKEVRFDLVKFVGSLVNSSDLDITKIAIEAGILDAVYNISKNESSNVFKSYTLYIISGLTSAGES